MPQGWGLSSWKQIVLFIASPPPSFSSLNQMNGRHLSQRTWRSRRRQQRTESEPVDAKNIHDSLSTAPAWPATLITLCYLMWANEPTTQDWLIRYFGAPDAKRNETTSLDASFLMFLTREYELKDNVNRWNWPYSEGVIDDAYCP